MAISSPLHIDTRSHGTLTDQSLQDSEFSYDRCGMDILNMDECEGLCRCDHGGNMFCHRLGDCNESTVKSQCQAMGGCNCVPQEQNP